jgi:tetratricopeptide (TPR) repeat protein
MAADEAIETVWRDLQHHLDWADGFALILLFTRHPGPVATLRERVADGLKLRTQKLRILAPASPEEIRALATEILATKRAPDRGSLWVELWRNPSDPDWQSARRWLLHRLNERRFLLERDLGASLILILPAEARGQFYVEAPDLWTIRSFTAELAAPTTRPARQTREEFQAPSVPGSLESPAELEWARLRRNSARHADADPRRLNPADGFAAFEAAMERGALQAARSIAGDVLDHCRSIRKVQGDTPQALRDLSIALDNVGHVERDLGDLTAARDAYRESLDIRRQLWQALGDTPQVLRDLSISLNNLGIVEQDLGDLVAAREALRESLDICRQLCAAFPAHPQFRKDLAARMAAWERLDPAQTQSDAP